jgi:hypothetical protein
MCSATAHVCFGPKADIHKITHAKVLHALAGTRIYRRMLLVLVWGGEVCMEFLNAIQAAS